MGALEALEKAGGPVLRKRIVLIGAGGSARAIAFEGMARGAEVVIYNRTESKAKQVAQSLGCLGGGIELLKEPYDILVNCTPDGLPIDPDLLLHGKLVMDISVNPTRLLAIAKSKQCRVVDGMQMYVQQALLQRAIWF
jgi:shikimate 5-dehydrogenase